MNLNRNYFIAPPPANLQNEFEILFTQNAVDFLANLLTTFETRIDQLYACRLEKKCHQQLHPKALPKFSNNIRKQDEFWKVAPVPERLLDRRLDLGDVSPANTQHFHRALGAKVQGVQVDFDDGHCPTWKNQITGLFNVYQVIHGNILTIPHVSKIPILMLRPRAWNMIEHNIMINGRKPPGTLVDFAILMFHNARILTSSNSGPFFYLSKLEGAAEAKLWNDIFMWVQQKLNIPYGTIKACVLIENIYSAFEMEEILYELKDHSLGLNCGIWDYSASIICKFGDNPDFLLPDRNKYVDIHKHYLKKYIDLVVYTCHKRGAHATGGMAAVLVTTENKENDIQKVINSKKIEILNGVDGFMVYDLQLVPYMNELWAQHCPVVNQLNVIKDCAITEADLLKMPSGGITYEGLKHNIQVSVLFIYNWLKGNGHFYYKNSVEDSATAEISRSQIWQWIRHESSTEDSDHLVSSQLVIQLANEFVKNRPSDVKLQTAMTIFVEISTARYFPDFITTYLNDHYAFQCTQNEMFESDSIKKMIISKL